MSISRIDNAFTDISRVSRESTYQAALLTFTVNRAVYLFLGINQFCQIPYLNSSLFERQSIEREININDVENLLVQKKAHSILGNKGNGKIPLLEYMIDFLNSYNFSACSDDELDEENREIVDAAVLGLIFEKLNGYKDGSHYTPSFITEYMCKDTIELAVLRKINKNMSWTCGSLYEVKERVGTSLEIARHYGDTPQY